MKKPLLKMTLLIGNVVEYLPPWLDQTARSELSKRGPLHSDAAFPREALLRREASSNEQLSKDIEIAWVALGGVHLKGKLVRRKCKDLSVCCT